MSVATSVISFIRCSLLPLMCFGWCSSFNIMCADCQYCKISRSVFYELMYLADFWILFSQQCLFIVLESSFPTQILFILFFCHSLFSFQCFHRNKKFPVENTESRVGEIMFMVFVFNLFRFIQKRNLLGVVFVSDLLVLVFSSSTNKLLSLPIRKNGFSFSQKYWFFFIGNQEWQEYVLWSSSYDNGMKVDKAR